MFGCNKCSRLTSLLILLLGIVLLLSDLGIWDFWGIQWSTGLFIILGFVGFCQGSCKDCQAMRRK